MRRIRRRITKSTRRSRKKKVIKGGVRAPSNQVEKGSFRVGAKSKARLGNVALGNAVLAAREARAAGSAPPAVLAARVTKKIVQEAKENNLRKLQERVSNQADGKGNYTNDQLERLNANVERVQEDYERSGERAEAAERQHNHAAGKGYYTDDELKQHDDTAQEIRKHNDRSRDVENLTDRFGRIGLNNPRARAGKKKKKVRSRGLLPADKWFARKNP